MTRVGQRGRKDMGRAEQKGFKEGWWLQQDRRQVGGSGMGNQTMGQLGNIDFSGIPSEGQQAVPSTAPALISCACPV